MARTKWSYKAGERPNTVRVYERVAGGPLYIAIWDPSARNGKGNLIRECLGHKDRQKAREHARQQATELERGRSEFRSARPTLNAVFRRYVQDHTPTKSRSEQQADHRRIEMWTRVLGPDCDPTEVRDREWKRFIKDRSSGAIDARGVRSARGVKVRKGTVEADCRWLKGVFMWAATGGGGDGGPLISDNPIRGFKVPEIGQTRRPVATPERYRTIRSVSDSVEMTVRWEPSPRKTRSHLSELLDIVSGTGRRLSAVCKLRYHDLRLEQGPFGMIRWPADTDKMKRETVVPINARVRRALDRILAERPGEGAAPLFPSPGDRTIPTSRHLADRWLRKGERLAGLEPQDGSLWHAYRRMWATKRKHLPDVDVAAAGGWSDTRSLKVSYQIADLQTLLDVVTHGEDDE